MDGRHREYERVSRFSISTELIQVRFGDGEWKSSGVTAEPEVTSKIIDGP